MTFEEAVAACDELDRLVEQGPGWDEIAVSRCQEIIDSFLHDLRVRGYPRRTLASLQRWFRAFFDRDDPLQFDPSRLLPVVLRKELDVLRKYVMGAFQQS